MVWIKDYYDSVLVNLDNIIYVENDNRISVRAYYSSEDSVLLFEGAEMGDADDYFDRLVAFLHCEESL